VTLFHLGEFPSALAHLERGIALYDLQKHHSHAFLYGTDPGVACLSYLARALWFLGYPDQALSRSHEALNLAEQLSHAYTLGYALHVIAMLHKERREAQLVQERSEAAIALSSKQGFIRWLGGGIIRRGWALAERGEVEEGIAQLRHGLATWQTIGELGLPQFLAMLAEAYSRGRRAEEGLRLLAEGMAAAHKTGERHYEAELYRLKGELLLQVIKGDTQAVHTETSGMVARAAQTSSLQTEAEICFLQAIDVARHQCAKSLELRAIMSLSRLWQQQGKRAEASKMLAGIYGWFTEGFDTLDLQEAIALLKTVE